MKEEETDLEIELLKKEIELLKQQLLEKDFKNELLKQQLIEYKQENKELRVNNTTNNNSNNNNNGGYNTNPFQGIKDWD